MLLESKLSDLQGFAAGDRVSRHIFCESELRTVKAIGMVDNLLTQFQLSSSGCVVEATVFLLLGLLKHRSSLGCSHVTRNGILFDSCCGIGDELMVRFPLISMV